MIILARYPIAFRVDNDPVLGISHDYKHFIPFEIAHFLPAITNFTNNFAANREEGGGESREMTRLNHPRAISILTGSLILLP